MQSDGRGSVRGTASALLCLEVALGGGEVAEHERRHNARRDERRLTCRCSPLPVAQPA